MNELEPKRRTDDAALRAAFHEGWIACAHMGGTLSEEECWQDSLTKRGGTFAQEPVAYHPDAPEEAF